MSVLWMAQHRVSFRRLWNDTGRVHDWEQRIWSSLTHKYIDMIELRAPDQSHMLRCIDWVCGCLPVHLLMRRSWSRLVWGETSRASSSHTHTHTQWSCKQTCSHMVSVRLLSESKKSVDSHCHQGASLMSCKCWHVVKYWIWFQTAS